MKRTFSMLALIAASNLYSIDPDTLGKELLKKDIQKTQQKLSDALEGYKNPTCIETFFFGEEKYKKIYAAFVQCAQNPQFCKHWQAYDHALPHALRSLASEIYNAQWRYKKHEEFSYYIAWLERERAELSATLKIKHQEEAAR